MNSEHAPQWTIIDPTGGDPFMGGPVTIEVCKICQVERTSHPTVTPVR